MSSINKRSTRVVANLKKRFQFLIVESFFVVLMCDSFPENRPKAISSVKIKDDGFQINFFLFHSMLVEFFESNNDVTENPEAEAEEEGRVTSRRKLRTFTVVEIQTK